MTCLDVKVIGIYLFTKQQQKNGEKRRKRRTKLCQNFEQQPPSTIFNAYILRLNTKCLKLFSFFFLFDLTMRVNSNKKCWQICPRKKNFLKKRKLVHVQIFAYKMSKYFWVKKYRCNFIIFLNIFMNYDNDDRWRRKNHMLPNVRCTYLKHFPTRNLGVR